MGDTAPTGDPPPKPLKRALDLGAEAPPGGAVHKKEAVDGARKTKKRGSEADRWRTEHEQQIRKVIDAERLCDAVPRYHLFQGHRQAGKNGGGGSQVGEQCEIFEKLGLSCWRDLAQAKQDVAAMIRGVARSSVYTLYLTSDALSYYVTLEARAAMELGKPVIIFLEDDGRKSSYVGSSVEAATEGWPADLKEYFWTGRFFAWGGRPHQLSAYVLNGRLRTMLSFLVADPSPQVPHVAGIKDTGWSDALAAISDREKECTPPAGEPSDVAAGGGRVGGGGSVCTQVGAAQPDELHDRSMSAGVSVFPAQKAALSAAAVQQRYKIMIDPNCLPRKGVAVEELRKLNSVTSVCMDATPAAKSGSPGWTEQAQLREELDRARIVGSPAHERDAQHAPEPRVVLCGDLVLVPVSSSGLVYGKVISNEKEEMPREWSVADMEFWLDQQGLGSEARAFEGKSGENFLTWFDRGTRQEMQAALTITRGLEASRLKTWEDILDKLLTPADKRDGYAWLRSPSPVQQNLLPFSPGERGGFL